MDELINEQEEFRNNILRALRAAQRRVQTDPKPTLSEQTRQNARHLLETYALDFPAAWPQTRDLLLLLAPKLEQAGYREPWLATLLTALQRSEAVADQAATAQIHYHIGEICRLASRHAEAERRLQISRSLFAAQEEATKEAQCLNRLAYLLLRIDRFPEAIAFATQAMQLVEENSLEYSMSLSALGLVAELQTRSVDAEQYHRRALEIRQAYNVRKEIAWSMQNLGITLRQRGEFEESTRCLRDALHLLAAEEDIAHKAIVQMNLAANYQITGEPQRALGLLSEAESAFNRVSDEFNFAKLLTTKGLCYLALRSYEQAESAFTMSAELFDKYDSLGWRLNALDGVGITYLEREWYARALQLFESIAQKLPDIEGTAAHRFLAATLPRQIEQARTQHVNIGSAVFQYEKETLLD
ncbi:MAG: tetratricopeptide repeat protein [Caldilineaceae bacterium]|nr:tetratricopeptide repeat protein [Caldilineaceae bacterium]